MVLCQLGVDPHVMLPHVRFNGHSALSLAASKGHKAVLGQLVTHGMNSRQINSNGHTALQCAAMGGHAEVVRLLHKIGCDVDAQTHHTGDTALHMAVHLHHVDVVVALLELNANIHLENNQGFTALQSPSLQWDPLSMRSLRLTMMLQQVCRHPAISPTTLA